MRIFLAHLTSGQIGNAEIVWKKKQLKSLEFKHDLLQKELEKENLRESDKDQLEAILLSKECHSYHSLEFINWIKRMTSILDDKDIITFCLTTDHPLKTTIYFKKLGNSSMVSYFAPRIDEIEFEDDEELQDF